MSWFKKLRKWWLERSQDKFEALLEAARIFGDRKKIEKYVKKLRKIKKKIDDLLR